MSRKPTCTCGTCHLCKNREYKRIRAIKKRESAVQYPIETNRWVCIDDSEFDDRLEAYIRQIDFHINNAMAVIHPTQIKVWRCSDNTIFTSEIHALRHEFDLFKRGR